MIRRHAAKLYLGVLLLAWGLYWLAFFPGIIPHDALVQWGQIAAGHYDDSHPAFHTFLLWLLTRIYPSFGVVSGAQVVVAAMLVGHLLGESRRLGAPAWLVGVTLFWLAVAPVFSMNLITVSRDACFALSLLLTTALLVRLAEGRATRLVDGVVLGLTLASVSLLRHNGPAVALTVLAGVAWWSRRAARGAIVAAAVVCVATVLVMRGPIYRAVDVVPMSPLVSEGYLIHQVAGLLRAGTPVANDEKHFLSSIAPLPVWRSAYDCADSYPLLYRAGLDVRPLADEPTRLIGIWAAMSWRNPSAMLRHWRCVTAFVRRHRGGPYRPEQIRRPHAGGARLVGPGESVVAAAGPRPNRG